jgi:hypothetical protein
MQEELVLEDVVNQFRQLRKLADAAMRQVAEGSFFAQLDEESNSIAVVVKHLAGNLRSRWTEFLTSDGEKPDRNRDNEFLIEKGDAKESLLKQWEAGWGCLFDALKSLSAADLSKTVLIRREPHSVIRAIHRSLTHCAYHVGQIVILAKHFAGPDWRSLSIPRGRSQQFNAEMQKKGKAQ